MEGSAFGGYGELTLNIPGRSLLEPTDHSVVDLRRFVLFFGHNFSDRLRFYSELEIEHAISSAGDRGEAEVEQAYLDGLLIRRFNLRGGLVNMPGGDVKRVPRAPTLNGVDRPAVDLYVVPTTWREPAWASSVRSERGCATRPTWSMASTPTTSPPRRHPPRPPGAQLARASDWGASFGSTGNRFWALSSACRATGRPPATR